jgi:hypothetical protein
MFQQYFYHEKQRHVPKQKFRFKRVETQAFKKAVKKALLKLILFFIPQQKKHLSLSMLNTRGIWFFS